MTIPRSYDRFVNSCVLRELQSGTVHVNVIDNRGSIFSTSASGMPSVVTVGIKDGGEVEYERDWKDWVTLL